MFRGNFYGFVLVQILSLFIFLYFSAAKLRYNITDLNLVNEACNASCWRGQTRTKVWCWTLRKTRGLDSFATSSFKIMNNSTKLSAVIMLPEGLRVVCSFFHLKKNSCRQSRKTSILELITLFSSKHFNEIIKQSCSVDFLYRVAIITLTGT